MYKCTHDTSLLEGRADGIFCRGCCTLFKSFADINPDEKKDDKIPPDAPDNESGADDNMTDVEPSSEPPAEDDDPEKADEAANDEAEAKPKPARRGRPKKEEADNA